MKYTKKLLARETRDYQDELYYGSLFEGLNNEKTLEEIIKKTLTKLEKVDGPVHVAKREFDKIHVLTDEENENRERLMNTIVYKKVRETRKPFFNDACEETEGEIYAGFPINFKGKFNGILIVEKKQDFKQWKELYSILHFIAFVFRHYDLVEKERDMNIRDGITGLYNEKYFFNQFELEESKYIRFKNPMTLVLFEVGNLAKINDTLGYEVGEKVLKYVGEIIQSQSRKYDMPARIERGLFAVLLSNTHELGGEAICNRVKNWIGDAIEIDGKEVEIDFRAAYSEFQNHFTKENFFAEIYKKMNE